MVDQPALNHLHRSLVHLIRESEAKCALLVDQDGQCITKKGFTQNLDAEALSALIAGSFASTRAMAKLVGENEFTVLFHQGETDSIHNVLVDDDTILCVIFDDRTTIGMVRLYAKTAAQEMSATLSQLRASQVTFTPENGDLANGEGSRMGDAAASKLDDLFSEG
jgi:predicted regulator of Ras-like GTPase activity (Roadblock/LC7/MglB family)